MSLAVRGKVDYEAINGPVITEETGGKSQIPLMQSISRINGPSIFRNYFEGEETGNHLNRFDENNSNSRQVLNATETRLSDEVAVTTSTANQLLAANQINAFPNPAKGNLQIQFDELPEQVLLLNNQGKIVRSLPTNLSNTISVSSLTPGLYILKAQFENGIGTKKIVISR